jgi:hypothetical protein
MTIAYQIVAMSEDNESARAAVLTYGFYIAVKHGLYFFISGFQVNAAMMRSFACERILSFSVG